MTDCARPLVVRQGLRVTVGAGRTVDMIFWGVRWLVPSSSILWCLILFLEFLFGLYFGYSQSFFVATGG